MAWAQQAAIPVIGILATGRRIEAGTQTESRIDGNAAGHAAKRAARKIEWR
jgi:hypothetical protein